MESTPILEFFDWLLWPLLLACADCETKHVRVLWAQREILMTRSLPRVLTVLLLLTAAVAAAGADAPLFNPERALTTRRGMAVLGSWATANVAVSGPLWFGTEASTRCFHEMNVAWNVLNLGIAGAGIVAESRAVPATNLESALAAQRRLESTLTLNIGLDAAYMAAGWALLERAQRGGPQAERWTGYGSSLILQGGFLFVFDIGFLLFQRQNRPVVTESGG